ncbi:MAG: sulfur carrier protein ThiS adenylyltransferase ThiF [Candidatus Cloacimonetes bacterium]|jgi:sulfur carrier protein ThiS adenylyltransferase|nr:sulfur carrier protein ThiS adenylyltransferase ThiF [Candidatus Cloacimonadota bacterium]MBT4333069.1 sulfur carrier protein ThiS adenylyltransferase ThiF [Candidatus Cloacimonadota bacterium]
MNKKEFFSAHDPKIVSKLQNSIIGIAGAGGLGSNIAVSLTRAGIGKLIISDFDKIEPSNLNRQQFFIDQIGTPKVIALLENLKKISRFTEYQVHEIKLNEENIPIIYKDVDILIEAFDKAEMKKTLIETWFMNYPNKPLIAASGLSGWGKNEILHTRKIDNLYICGDEETNLIEGISPMAPRVGIVANMQANLVLELLLNNYENNKS